MLQLKNDIRFLDKKFILGYKTTTTQKGLSFQVLDFLADSEAPRCMEMIIFRYLWLFLEPNKCHSKDLQAEVSCYMSKSPV